MIRIHRNCSDLKIYSWCVQGKTRKAPEPLYETVLALKVTKLIGLWYPYLSNLGKFVSLSGPPSISSYLKAIIVIYGGNKIK